MRLDVGFRFNFLPIPTDIHFGYGVLDTLPERLDGLRGKKAFLITDTGLKDVGILDQIERILKSSKRDFLVYDGVEPDSGSDLIAEATSRLRSSSADVVVGIGGGSSLDTAKAVAVMATNTGSIVDYVGLNKVPHRPLPVIAIPTTAGTGCGGCIASCASSTAPWVFAAASTSWTTSTTRSTACWSGRGWTLPCAPAARWCSRRRIPRRRWSGSPLTTSSASRALSS